MGGYGRRFDPPATRRLGSGSPGRSPHASFAVGEERLGRERCREWSPLALSPSLAARGSQQVGHPQQQHQPLRVLGQATIPHLRIAPVSHNGCSTFALPTPRDAAPPDSRDSGAGADRAASPPAVPPVAPDAPPASGLPDTPHRPTPGLVPVQQPVGFGHVVHVRRRRPCYAPSPYPRPLDVQLHPDHSSPASPDASPGPARLPDSSSRRRWMLADRPFTQPQSLADGG